MAVIDFHRKYNYCMKNTTTKTWKKYYYYYYARFLSKKQLEILTLLPVCVCINYEWCNDTFMIFYKLNTSDFCSLLFVSCTHSQSMDSMPNDTINKELECLVT